MNQFEIKTIKQNLNDKNLVEIYQISDEHNIKDYGHLMFEAVIEYAYKEEKYLFGLRHSEENETEGKNKIDIVKDLIEEEVEEIERMLYRISEEEMIYDISSVIGQQVELWYVKEEIPITQSQFEEQTNNIKEEIQYKYAKGIRGLDLYKEGIEFWNKFKSWECADE